MERTLRSKYISLFIKVMEADPKHFNDVYHKSFGFIESEWDWCNDILQNIKQMSEYDMTHEFNKEAIKLVQYLRYKRTHPDEQYKYPDSGYKLQVNKPGNKITYLEFSFSKFPVFFTKIWPFGLLCLFAIIL